MDTKESPTITQKLGAILRQPWNRDLREESLSQETIARLKASPVLIVQDSLSDRERGARWSDEHETSDTPWSEEFHSASPPK